MNIKIKLSEIRNIIANGDTRSSFKAIDEKLFDDLSLDDKNYFIIQKSRFENIHREYNLGTVQHSDKTGIINNINFALLEILARIEEKNQTINYPKNEDQKFRELSNGIKIFQQEYNNHIETITKFKNIDNSFVRILSSNTLNGEQMEQINLDFSIKINNLIKLNNSIIELKALQNLPGASKKNQLNFNTAETLVTDITEKMTFSEVEQYHEEIKKLITKIKYEYNKDDNQSKGCILLMIIGLISYIIYIAFNSLIGALTFLAAFLLLATFASNNKY